MNQSSSTGKIKLPKIKVTDTNMSTKSSLSPERERMRRQILGQTKSEPTIQHKAVFDEAVVLIKPTVDASTRELHARNDFRSAATNLKNFLYDKDADTMLKNVFQPTHLGAFGKDNRGTKVNTMHARAEVDYARDDATYAAQADEFDLMNREATDEAHMRKAEELRRKAILKAKHAAKWQRVNIAEGAAIGASGSLSRIQASNDEEGSTRFDTSHNDEQSRMILKSLSESKFTEYRPGSDMGALDEDETRSVPEQTYHRVYARHTEDEVADMRRIVRELGELGERLDQADRSRDYEEDFETDGEGDADAELMAEKTMPALLTIDTL